MARLLHDVWFDPEGLPGCVLAGPAGDSARKFYGEGSRLVHTFEAGSNFEAMQIYYAYLGRGRWESSFPEQDNAPYPEEWLAVQRSHLGKGAP
jgi:hypothetical protein